MLARFNGNVVPFANDATSTNRTVFGGTTQSDTLDDNLNADFKKGWEIVGLNDSPTREDFNAMGYTLGALTSYLYQMGIAEYNKLQEYKLNGLCLGTDGTIYQSLVDANIGNALTDGTKWKNVTSSFVDLVNNQSIDGIKTFVKSPIVPTPTTNSQVATKEYVDNNMVPELIWIKPLSRQNKPLFIKVNPHSISIPDGFKVAVNKKIINLTSDYILSLNSDLDTGTKIAGKDYYVYAKDDGTFYLSANNAITVNKLIGGFHYGLTGETEVRPANALKTEDDMVANRGIKAYSMWDLSWKPANKRPEGKVLVNNIFWRDIYPADEDYALRGYSSCFALDGVTSAKIAGGEQTNGRKFPKIPLSKGGNGTLNYGSLTWFEANEIISEVGMRMISYDEFSNSSYGVVEQKSLQELGYPIGTGIIKHYPELESKWGVEMAVGVQWFWTKELMNGYGTTDFANRTGVTDGRGYLYATSNSPVAGLCGGQEQHNSTIPVGSRALMLYYCVWFTNWAYGFVAVCDHMNLDK